MSNDTPQNALNLRRIWNKKKSEMQFTQVTAAKDLEWTQGAISHYLTGETPLGLSAILKFANFLGVDPADIDPNVRELYPNTVKRTLRYRSSDLSKKINEEAVLSDPPDSFWIELTPETLLHTYYQKNAVVVGKGNTVTSHALVYEADRPERQLHVVLLKGEKQAHVYHVSCLPDQKKIKKRYNVVRIVHDIVKM